MRSAEITRDTLETQIRLRLNLDGTGRFEGSTGIGFTDHMLTLLAKHGGFDLAVDAKGDLETDTHHLMEDLGICLGQAFKEALGDKKGIRRYGFATRPMDEVLVSCACDFSGRFYFVGKFELASEKIGDFETQTLREFLYAFSVNAMMNLHVIVHYGVNDHHIVEGIFKTMAAALKDAAEIVDEDGDVLSTKGVL